MQILDEGLPGWVAKGFPTASKTAPGKS